MNEFAKVGSLATFNTITAVRGGNPLFIKLGVVEIIQLCSSA